MPLALSTGLALPIADIADSPTDNDPETADTAGTVSRSGANLFNYASVGKSIFLDSVLNITIYAYEAWDDVNLRRCYITWLDHNTGTLGPEIDVGLVGLVNDNHGIPAIEFDHQRHLHAFGCAHGADMKHASTTNPVNDPLNLVDWTVRANIAGNYGYPHPTLVGSAMYLVMRNTTAGDLGLRLRVTTALSNGVATWGSEISLINPEGSDGDRVYAGTVKKVGTQLWFPWTLGITGDVERRHLYFEKYETTDGSLSNFSGSSVIASGSLPLTRATADASHRIYEHTGTRDGTDVPVWDIDGSNDVYIFFSDGEGEGPFDVLMIRSASGVLQAPEDTTVDVLGRYATYACLRLSDGQIELYYPEANGNFDLDGDMNRIIRSLVPAWVDNERIITGVGLPLTRPIASQGGHANAKVFMGEGIPDDDTDASAGGLRGYLYGDQGFVTRPEGVQNIVAPTIEGAPNVGELLTVDEGDWRAYPQAQYTYPVVDFTYQWFADGVEIVGATNSQYTLTSDELDALITVRVTGANGVTSLDVTSASVGPVEEQVLAFFPVQKIWVPEPPPFSPQSAFTSSVIDATGEKFAWIGRVWNPDRTTKSIRKVGFRFGTVTKSGGSGLTVSLQNVDTANGPPYQPDGTQDQTVAIANGDAGFASNTWYQTAALSADRSVAFGELIAVVIEYDGSGRLGSDTVSLNNIATSPVQQTLGGSLLTASWAAVAIAPNVILEFSDGTFGTLEGGYPASAITATAFNSGSTPDERALEFTFPVAVKADGAWINVSVAGGTSDFDVVIYEGTTAHRTVSIDANTVRVASGGIVFVTFAEITFSKDVTYKLALKPTTANNVSAYYIDVANADHKQAFIGESWNYTERTDGGAWSATTLTRQLFGGIRLSSIQG